MFRVSVFLFALILMLVPVTSTQAGEAEERALERLFGTVDIEAEEFGAEFISQVPLAQLQLIFAQTRETLGPVSAIEAKGGSRYLVSGDQYELPVDIVLDANGQIIGLLLGNITASGQSLEEALSSFDALPGELSYLVLTNGEVVAEQRAESPLAVGSAFKLGILSALKDRIDAGEVSWRDVLELEADQISLSSAHLQGHPAGSPFTLHSLAASKISVSDNTATDMLLDFVGRDIAAEKLGIDFVLKTRELFQLKADPALTEAFLAADGAGRAGISDQLANAPLPQPGEASGPHVAGLEWYVELDTLCALAAETAQLDVFAINPGLAEPTDWKRIAFKGGSETGVLNFTTYLEAEDGSTHCVAMSWNADQPLDQAQAGVIYSSVIKSLRTAE